jgi:hypothetical protein
MVEAIDSYKIFTKDKYSPKPRDTKARLDHELFERQLMEMITGKGLDPNVPLESSNPDACKTFVVTLRNAPYALRTPILMRTYNTPESSQAFPATIWQAARATTAAPMLYLPVVIDDIEYSDGGPAFNNPTELAIEEAQRIWPDRTIGCLVSVGPGMEDTIQSVQLARHAKECEDLSEWFSILLLKSHDKHLDIEKRAETLGINGSYFRFDTPCGRYQRMSKPGGMRKRNSRPLGVFEGSSTPTGDNWEEARDAVALAEPYSFNRDNMSVERDSVALRLLNPSIVSYLPCITIS